MGTGKVFILHISFTYINTFRFVLYQLSKNLNRPFFMDLLTQLSVRFTDESRNDDYEEDPNDSGGIGYNPVNNPHHTLPGDNLLSMLLKPSFTTNESEKVNK